jgi:hypothetical protein
MERQKAFIAPKESKAKKVVVAETEVDVEKLKRKLERREERKLEKNKKQKTGDAKSFLV